MQITDTPLPQRVAEIELAATAAGISLAQACKRIGVHPTTWGRWKRGLTKPSFDKLAALGALEREVSHAHAHEAA